MDGNKNGFWKDVKKIIKNSSLNIDNSAVGHSVCTYWSLPRQLGRHCAWKYNDFAPLESRKDKPLIDALDEPPSLSLERTWHCSTEIALLTLALVLGRAHAAAFTMDRGKLYPLAVKWQCRQRFLPSYVILRRGKWPLLYKIEVLNQPADTSCSSHVKVLPESHHSRWRASATLWYSVYFALALQCSCFFGGFFRLCVWSQLCSWQKRHLMIEKKKVLLRRKINEQACWLSLIHPWRPLVGTFLVQHVRRCPNALIVNSAISKQLALRSVKTTGRQL